MGRFLDLYNENIRGTGYPVNVESAWLHHRFVRTHPFQDGNGRVSRLLMASAYIKRGLPPPVVSAENKFEYILALESADEGSLKDFSDYIGALSMVALQGSVTIAQNALAGRLNRPNGNGGRTVGDEYFPPVSEGALERDEPAGGPSGS